MKGFRILMVAGALVALAPSANALVKGAPELAAEIGRTVAAGTALNSQAAVAQLMTAGFEASVAKALVRTLTNPANKEKVSGIDWSRFENANRALSLDALSVLIAKIDTVESATAFTAEYETMQVNAVVAGPASSADPELVARQFVPQAGSACDAACIAKLEVIKDKADSSDVDRRILELGGLALLRVQNEFPDRKLGEETTALWMANRYPAHGQGAFDFFAGKPKDGSVVDGFNKTYSPVVTMTGMKRHILNVQNRTNPNQQVEACATGQVVSANR